jgi:2-methylcitrate dehydratase PrpD
LKDLGLYFSEFAHNIEYSSLPARTVEITKQFILDTLGVSIAGWKAKGCKEVYKLVSMWGGKPESTIWVYGFRLPAPNAAFVNGTMAHSLEFDDLHDEAHVHTFAPVLASAIASGELLKNIKGKDLIPALVVGVDIMCRLGLAITVERGWHYSLSFGVFGAALAAGKILNLNKKQIMHALGIAFSHVAGTEQCVIEGALIKRMHPGIAAKTGIWSALLAKEGITGPANIFEGSLGYFKIYENDIYDREKALKRLGKQFEVENLRVKPYPCCGYAHPAIEAALVLKKEYNVQPQEIKSIYINVSKVTHDLLGSPPSNECMNVKGQFSIPYIVSVAIIYGHVFLEHFEITEKEELNHKVNKTRGHPTDFSMEDTVKKFRKCIEYTKQDILEKRIDEIINVVLNIEDTPIELLTNLLCLR